MHNRNSNSTLKEQQASSALTSDDQAKNTVLEMSSQAPSTGPNTVQNKMPKTFKEGQAL